MGSVVTTKGVDGVPVSVLVVVSVPDSTTVCAEAMGANSSPLPSAIDTANADNETPADSAPICGDMLTTRPFHLVIRPPRKSSQPAAWDESSDVFIVSVII